MLSRDKTRVNREALTLAAHMANPWGERELPSTDEAAFSAAAAVLGLNNVSFLGLRRKFGALLDGTPFSRPAYEEEEVFAKTREEFERVRTDFERNGVRTMLFKATGLYPSFPHLSSNLDVLVEPARGDVGRKRLLDLGYVELVNVEEPAKFLFRRFAADGFCYTFHLHEQVGWGVPFLDTDAVWKGARPAPDDGGLTIPGPAEALLVTVAHWFYEDKVLTLQNLFHTAHALRILPVPLLEAGAGARARGWGDGFLAAIKIFDESWGRLFGEGFLDPEQAESCDREIRAGGMARSGLLRRVEYGAGHPARIPFAANKVVYYKKVFRDTRRSVREKTGDLVKTLLWAVRWKLRVRSQKPFLVAVCGVDGSGKTLQASRLAGVFGTCDLRVRTVWARGASSRLMSLFIGPAKKLIPSGRPRPPADAGDPDRPRAEAGDDEWSKTLHRRSRLENPLVRFFFAVLYAIDLALVYFFKTRLYLATGHVIICDRYTMDALVDFAILSGTSALEPPLPLRLLRAVAPRPNVAFLLDVDEHEALRRKPSEGSAEHLGEARRMFRALAAGGDVHVLGPGLEPGVIGEAIARSSLSGFYGRGGTLVNWLLASNPEQLNPGRWRQGGVQG